MSYLTRNQIERQKDKLYDQISKLDAQLKYISNDPTIQLADAIHYATCHQNHTDGCGYEYSTWDNPNSEKSRSYDKAKRILAIVPLEKALEIIDIIN